MALRSERCSPCGCAGRSDRESAGGGSTRFLALRLAVLDAACHVGPSAARRGSQSGGVSMETTSPAAFSFRLLVSLEVGATPLVVPYGSRSPAVADEPESHRARARARGGGQVPGQP